MSPLLPIAAASPTEANLRRAREQLAAIKERITSGTFSFADEFPDFRDLRGCAWRRLAENVRPFRCFPPRCEFRMAKDDMAPITFATSDAVCNALLRTAPGREPNTENST
jgi:hypothetical protein